MSNYPNEIFGNMFALVVGGWMAAATIGSVYTSF